MRMRAQYVAIGGSAKVLNTRLRININREKRLMDMDGRGKVNGALNVTCLSLTLQYNASTNWYNQAV